MAASDFIPIPRGTQPRACTGPSCREMIYWAPHPSSGRAHPAACDAGFLPQAKPPTPSEDGIGYSHYKDCVDRDKFSKTKPNKPLRK